MKAKITLIVAVLISLISASAFADGFLVPIDEKIPIQGAVNVRFHRVLVDIKDQAATTTIEQIFENPGNTQVEVNYVFPLPRGAVVSNFSMLVDDKDMKGKLMSAKDARAIYEQIVRSRKDPALLEYIGQGIYRTGVFHIPAKGSRLVKITYSEVLEKEGNLIELVYPLSTEKYSGAPLQDVEVKVDIHSKSPIRNVYSPSHNIQVEKFNDKHVMATWHAKNERPDSDFKLFYSVSPDEIGASLITYRPLANEDGFFLLLASPSAEIKERKSSGKNFVFVLDHSGSMSGAKLKQAKGALRFVLENLSEKDMFNVVYYDDTVKQMFEGIKKYNRKSKNEAVAKLGKITADGGTNINDALKDALKLMPNNKKPNIIVFITDGLPTSGITAHDQIIKNVANANKSNTRVFVFGVGYDVDAIFLDKLAAKNHGATDYVGPNESIEAKISKFYGKIKSPVLTGLKIKFDGIRTSDIFPRELPDIFKGSQLVMAGRYSGSGTHKVTISGQARGKNKKFTYKLNFKDATEGAENDFVSRMWASRKIGYLLDQIRLNGKKKELVNAIIKLSTRYGIITEYTSFLVEEDVDIHDDEMNISRMEKEMDKKIHIGGGKKGIMQSKNLAGMQKTAQAPNMTAQTFLNEEGEQQTVTGVRIIGQKTFYFKKGVWVDSEVTRKDKPIELKAFGRKFFNLVASQTAENMYLSFADQIIVKLHGKVYKIVNK